MTRLHRSRAALLIALAAGACGDAPPPPAGTPASSAEVTAPAVPPAPLPAPTPEIPKPGADAGTKPDAPAPAPSGAPAEAPPATKEEPAPKPVATAPSGAPVDAPRPPLLPETRPPAPVPMPVPQPIADAVTAAREAVAAGDAQRAITLLRDAEKAHGEHAAARLAIAAAHLALAEQELANGGEAFAAQGHVADAGFRWKQAVALDPAVAGGAVLRARIYRFEEKPKLAREVLDAHFAHTPDDPEAHRVLAEMATNGKDWAEAAKRWANVRKALPGDGRAWLESAVAEQWMGTPAPKLEEMYLRACGLLPEDDRAIRLLCALQKSREARLSALDKVIAGNAKAVRARIWKAWILRSEQPADMKAARAVLEEALRIDPTHSDAHANLAEVLRDTGAPLEEQLKAWTAAVEGGKAGAVSKWAGEIDRILNSREGATIPLPLRIRANDAAVAKLPGEGWFGNNAGFWFRDIGKDYELSLKYYLKAVEAEPDDQDYLNDCALIYLFHLTDRKDLSLPMFEKVLRLVEDEGVEAGRGYWDALENLCKYWFERGEYRKCLDCAVKRMNPEATLDGRPYPSMRAAGYKQRAEAALKPKK